MKFDTKPSFDFANGSVSSRTRSKTSNIASAASTIQSTFSAEKSELKAKPTRNTFAPQSKLPKLLEHILPLDIHARLAKEPQLCVGSYGKNPSEKCPCKQTSTQPLQDVPGVLAKLAECKDKEDYHGMLGYIVKLIQTFTCGRHQNVALKASTAERKEGQPEAKSRVEQLRAMLEDTTKMGEVNCSIFTSWINVISNPNASIKHIHWIYSIAKASKATPESKSTPIAHQTPIPVSSSPNFTPYQQNNTQGLSVFSALHNKATSPLGAKDVKSGFIYIFWDKQHFGKVKIGFTNDLTRRLEEWNRDCKRDHLYHPNDGIQVNMKHVHRVEQLIHTELKEFRRKRRCEGCGKMHVEWFDVPEVHAGKVARKWRDWILQEPYMQDAVSKQWTIRPGMLDTLERMCEPLPQEVSAQGGPRRSVRIQRSSLKKEYGQKMV